MHVYVIIAHPSKESFTRAVFDEFTRGLEDAGNTFEVGDLYEMGFEAILNLEEYDREMGMDASVPLPDDVKAEHEKIDKADALAFVYPLWWGDCPARLKGWFDRVFTYGFAYVYEGDAFKPCLKVPKALVICAAGDEVESLERHGIAPSMRHVMLDNRLRGSGVADAELVILGGMSVDAEAHRKPNLEEAYRLGKEF
jgi:NAD(P)H dehydrogenase (quinone)